jgi:8-oxo-dGTP pyrophosphatase MutT (NUDIX family)
MNLEPLRTRRVLMLAVAAGVLAISVALPQAQQPATDARDPKQLQDQAFATLYKEWTGDARYGSPLVDHLPIVKGVPTPKDVLGYYIGAPRKLTYYADILKYYRALAAATPRVRVESIGKSDEGRELVVVWVSSDQNMKGLRANRDRLAKLADPRGRSEAEIQQLITTTKPNYHITGGLHSGESGPPEMLMELVYRIATETSPIITLIRNNVYVSVTPVAEPDGRDRYLDWFYKGLETTEAAPSGPARPAGDAARGAQSAGGVQPAANAGQGAGQRGAEAQGGGGQRGGGGAMAVPYLGKYVGHDDNRDINIALVPSRALTEWYYTAHPPIMHDLHESMSLLYTYSGGPPQNPNYDPLLFAELPWFANWELAQMTKWGMPGVYTHAFMDGWSPGYYASVVYNHNGLMKMYETQSGRDPVAAPAAQAPRGGAPADAPRGGAPGEGQRAGTSGAAPRGGAPAEAQRGEAAPAAQRGTPGEGQRAGTPPDAMRGGGPGGASAVPTGRGGTQDREWYRGLPVPPNAAASFSRRVNTNYMETGLLASLQLTAQFPTTIVENFYVKTRNAIEDGRTKAPFGFVIPVQRDMTRVAELLRILRIQGIEVGQAAAEFKLGDVTYPAGSYVIKRDQPYGRLAKNLLEKQVFPDTRLTTYDDSGWTMGLLMAVDVKEIADAAVLKVPTTPVTKVVASGKISGSGAAGFAVAHYGSNNMIVFRYKLRSATMKVAEKAFTAEGVEFPAGSFVIAGPPTAAAREAVEQLGLTAAALSVMPTVSMHDAPAPRIAIYSQWTATQDLGWYRLTFDNFGIPYDLIYKEQVQKGDLRSRYDVILMAAQNINRQTVLQAPSARPQPYQKSEKYKTLGMYGETSDMSGGFGQAGVDAFAKFLEGGGTLIAAGPAVRFPIEFGWAHTVDTEAITGVAAQRPVVQGELVRPEHPAFYGYTEKTVPIKYQGGVTLRVGVADQANLLARYVGGDSSVLTGSMVGADQLRQKAFAVDLPGACNGKGRVILFATNPIYRWQNHGEFNMVFNSLLNWNYVPAAAGR